jgi:hypothetical protein
MAKKSADEYDDKEARARFEVALKGAMNTPHKPLKEKPKVKAARETGGCWKTAADQS